MATYSLNDGAVARARRLIDARQYVLDSDWGEVQPRAADENAFLESHSWDEYAEWHLGLTEGAGEQTKARYGLGYGDFKRVHRTGLIACVYRAADGAIRKSNWRLTISSNTSTAQAALEPWSSYR